MLLITGATGALGRHLVDTLLTGGAEIRAVSRDPAAARLPAGIEVVAADPSRPDTMDGTLAGVTGMFLHPRAVGDAAYGIVAAARKYGVAKVVALSAINVDDDDAEQPSRYRGDRNREAEEAAAGSGLAWTSLRAGAFASNAAQAWGAQIRAGDVVRYPYAGFEECPVDERDLAEVAARALLTDELVGRRLSLTGPASITHADMVATIGAALGRPLRYEEVPPDLALRGMVAAGLPEPFVAALLRRYAQAPRQLPTDDVRRALGRPARTFADWVADHTDAFRTGPARTGAVPAV